MVLPMFYSLHKQTLSDLAEMIQGGPQAYDGFEDFSIFAYGLEELGGSLTNFKGRVIQLRHQQPQSPHCRAVLL